MLNIISYFYKTYWSCQPNYKYEVTVDMLAAIAFNCIQQSAWTYMMMVVSLPIFTFLSPFWFRDRSNLAGNFHCLRACLLAWLLRSPHWYLHHSLSPWALLWQPKKKTKKNIAAKSLSQSIRETSQQLLYAESAQARATRRLRYPLSAAS